MERFYQLVQSIYSGSLGTLVSLEVILKIEFFLRCDYGAWSCVAYFITGHEQTRLNRSKNLSIPNLCTITAADVVPCAEYIFRSFGIEVILKIKLCLSRC